MVGTMTNWKRMPRHSDGTLWASVAMWKPCQVSFVKKSHLYTNHMCTISICKSLLKLFENTTGQTQKTCVPNMAHELTFFFFFTSVIMVLSHMLKPVI